MMTPEEKQIFQDALNTIDDIKRGMERKEAEKSLRTLLKEINQGFIGEVKTMIPELKKVIELLNSVAKKETKEINEEALIKAIKSIKLEPQLEIGIPDIKVPKAEIEVKIPPIKVPKPEVTVNVPPLNFPKEMEVRGLAGFIIKILEAIKGVFRVEVQHNRDKPINVILVDEKGAYYKAGGMAVTGFGGGAPGSRKIVGSILTEDILTLTAANTQYTYELPDGVKALSFRLRSGNYDLRYSYQVLSAGKYRTLVSGASYNRENLEVDGKTLYFNCPDAAGEVVELEIWT